MHPLGAAPTAASFFEEYKFSTRIMQLQYQEIIFFQVGLHIVLQLVYSDYSSHGSSAIRMKNCPSSHLAANEELPLFAGPWLNLIRAHQERLNQAIGDRFKLH